MSVFEAVAAGLAGAMVVLVLVYAAAAFGLATTEVFAALGGRFTPDVQAAYTLGLGLWFVLGVGYALLYALLWSAGLGSPTWYWGLVFGAVHSGLAVRLMMRFLISRRPSPEEVPAALRRMASVWLLHLPHAVVVAVVYGFLEPPPAA